LLHAFEFNILTNINLEFIFVYMIPRTLSASINEYSREYPVIAIVGPRQSGKTTLARHLFPEYTYVSLENLDYRHAASDDPRGFLDDHGSRIILDEIQRVPELFSYLQERVDIHDAAAQYILTGSQQFLLMEKVSQSLAGRIATFKLFPFTLPELFQTKKDTSIAGIFSVKQKRGGQPDGSTMYEMVHTGMYPRIHDKKLTAPRWLENYVLTYMERDIRSLINVENLRTFENFLKVCASFSGQLLNYASISNAIGISQPTVKKWLSLLETSGVVLLLPPHHKNFSKRLIKSPKLYFLDTGLLCFLLSIRTPGELPGHPLFGSIFETFAVSELYKRICHIGEIPPLFFWRDKTGNEIDLIVEIDGKLLPVEIKSSKTYTPDFSAGIKKWFNLKGNTARRGMVIYAGGETVGKTADVCTVPLWYL